MGKNMDEETQPTVLSKLTALSVSDSSIDSIHTQLGSYMLPTVVALANQVSVEIRQSYPQCFSRLPIVVIERHVPVIHTSVKATDSSVTNVLPNICTKIKGIDDSQKQYDFDVPANNDKLSSVSNKESFILPNNEQKNCLKRPFESESLDYDEGTQKKKPAGNFMKEQFSSCNLKNNLKKDELSCLPNESFPNSIQLNHQPKSFIRETLKNKSSVNNVRSNNIQVKKELLNIVDEYEEDSDNLLNNNLNSERINSLLSENHDKNMDEDGKSCLNYSNVEMYGSDEMRDEIISMIEIIDLDHDYCMKSLPPEIPSQKPEVNKVSQLTKEIKSIQPDIINMKYLDRMVESDPVDPVNKIPTIRLDTDSVLSDQGIRESPLKIFESQSKEFKKDFSKFWRKACSTLTPELEKLLLRDDISFELLEKTVSKRIKEIMDARFGKYFQTERVDTSISLKKEVVWREKFESVSSQLENVKSVLQRHLEDLQIDINTVPLKIRRHVKVQTKMYKVTQNQLRASSKHKHCIVDNNGVVIDTTKFLKENIESIELITHNETLSSSTDTSCSVTNPPSRSIRVNLKSTSAASTPNSYTFKIDPDSQSVGPFPPGELLRVHYITADNKVVKLPKQSLAYGLIVSNVRSLKPPKRRPNVRKLRPVPPAIPIDEHVPSVPAFNQECIPSFIQLLPTQTERILDSRVVTSQIKPRPILPKSSLPQTESISLLSPEKQQKSDLAPSSNIGNKKILRAKRQMLPSPILKISNKLTSKVPANVFHTNGAKSLDKLPGEIIDLSYDSDESEAHDQSLSSTITNQKRLCVTQLVPASIKIIEVPKVATKQSQEIVVKTPNLLPLETIDLSDDSSNDTELSVPPSGIENQKYPNARLQQPVALRNEPKGALTVATKQSQEIVVKTPNLLPLEIIHLSDDSSDDLEIIVPPSGIENQKYPNARLQQPVAPQNEPKGALKAPTNIAHEIVVKIPNPLPPETIDISDDASSDLELSIPSVLSKMTNIKCFSVNTQQTWAPTEIKETSKDTNILDENLIKTSDSLSNEIIDLSDNSSNVSEINEPTSSREITNCKLSRIQHPSAPTELKKTLKDADVVAKTNSAKTSSVVPPENLNALSTSIELKVEDPTPLTGVLEQKKNPWKLLPLAPTLEITKKQNPEGIELTWNMKMTNDFAKIKSFKVYCAEFSPELAELPVNEEKWKEIGEVNCIPLPMSCVLKKRTCKINCLFTVRAVDVHNRVGPFCSPKAIFID